MYGYRIIRGIIILLIVAVVVMLSSFLWYKIEIRPVKNIEDSKEVTIDIGSGSKKIADKLKENNVIRSKLAFRVYVKIHNIQSFNAGKYEIKSGMGVKEITELLQTGVLYDDSQISITFLEGKTMRWYANKIAECTNNTEEDVYNLLSDTEYLDKIINKYWFLTDEIKNKKIYYSLEGYLVPDTYQFKNKDVTVEEIFDVLLSQTDKVLSKYKSQIEEKKYSVHKILTIASIVESEGINDDDKKDIASVLYNRIKNNMNLGSDVTTYYGSKVEVGSRDLYQSEINNENPYNTRVASMVGKIPVGPISSVGEQALDATLNPNQTDYLYFVADKNGKIYFSKTNEEHLSIISKLKEQGLWYEFE